MAVYEAADYAGDLFGWKAELGARIQDFFSRKAVPVTTKLGAIVSRIEHSTSKATLKGALRDLYLYLKREGPARADADEEAFFARILEYRRGESIENYSGYLFTVDLKF
jgi:hypothetical protein